MGAEDAPRLTRPQPPWRARGCIAAGTSPARQTSRQFAACRGLAAAVPAESRRARSEKTKNKKKLAQRHGQKCADEKQQGLRDSGVRTGYSQTGQLEKCCENALREMNPRITRQLGFPSPSMK